MEERLVKAAQVTTMTGRTAQKPDEISVLWHLAGTDKMAQRNGTVVKCVVDN